MIKEKVDTASVQLFRQKTILLGGMALTVLLVVLYALNKGIVFSDESWYLLHLRLPDAVIPYSQWHAYALKLFPEGILAIRIVTVLLLLLSGIIFSLCLTWKGSFTIFQALTTSIIGLFVLFMPVQFVPNYMTFNSIILFAGSGLYILALRVDTKKLVVIFSVLAGIIYGQLFFVMITNMAIYGMLIILPFLIQERKTAFINVLALFSGTIIGFLLFFWSIKGLEQFYHETLMAFKYHAFDESHGIKDLVKWSISTFTYIVKEVALPAILLLIIKWGKNINLKVKSVTIAVLVLYFLVITLTDLRTNFRNITPPTIILSIATFIIADLFINKNYREALIGLFCLFIPFFGCLGTDVNFSIRASLYSLPIIVFVLQYAIVNSQKKTFFFLIFFLLFATLRFSIQFTNASGWNGYRLSQQKIALSELNADEAIKLDQKRFNSLKELQTIINPGDTMLVSHHNLWGYVYLSEGVTPLLQFKFNEERLDFYFKQNQLQKTKLALIEDTDNPFPEGYVQSFGFKNYRLHQLKSNSGLNVYILNN